MAYKWFLGLDIDENPPDHSTMCQNRRRRFSESTIFREIFEEIIIKCYDAGLIDGKTILTDSTHVKASASNKSYETKEVQHQFNDYVDELDSLADIEIKNLHDKNIKANPKRPKEKTVVKKVSKTDPQSGQLIRPSKPIGFHYLNHASSDSKCGIIVDVEVTSAEVSDVSVYMERIKYIGKRFPFSIEEAVADSGYNRAISHYLLQKENINLYTPKIKEKGFKKYNLFNRQNMIYDESNDYFTCPANYHLEYKGINRNANGEVYKLYKTNSSNCKFCPLREKCLAPSKKRKEINVNVLEPCMIKGKELAKTERFKKLMKLRQTITEGNHALQKEHHNLSRTRKRGISKVLEHCLFSAMALNLKRLVKYS